MFLISQVICKYFIPNMWTVFLLSWWCPLKYKSFFNFNEIQSTYFFPLAPCTTGVISKKPLPNLRSQRFISRFSYKNFIAQALIFRSLNDSELIFAYGVKQASYFILSCVDYLVVPAPYVEKSILSSTELFLVPLLNSHWL